MIAFIEEGLAESEHQKLLIGVEEEMKKLRFEENSSSNNLEVIKTVESKKEESDLKSQLSNQKEQEHVVVMDFDDLVQYIGNNEAIAHNITKKSQAKKANKKREKEKDQLTSKKKTLMQPANSNRASQPHKSTSSGKQMTTRSIGSKEQEEEENKNVEVFQQMLLETSVHYSFVTKSQPNFEKYY